MREDYVPNEKYRNMFGVERNGYGMERVDLYLAQLEVAFKKIREDNRGLKRELAEGGAAQGGLIAPPQPEYAPQPGEHTAEQQELFQRLRAQLAEQQGLSAQLHAQLAEESDLRQRLQSQTESLMGQITALRGEADELRQHLRVQPGAAPVAPAYAEAPYDDEEKQQLIGRVLVEARSTAEETIRAARQEADVILRKARQRTEELRAEQERVYTQLQGVAYALRNVLREGSDSEINRGEEFAVS
ncbi:MAG: hypothetical protein LBS96_05760 [Oscillospiraceae bacterium]|jgi:small-conductance mechanosensitive channel|nr:hypothetical protein [Oscillospiraceae bacterium]